MVSTISSTAQAFLVRVASIISDSEINGSGVSATALTFEFLEEDGSAVPSSSEESAFRFLYQRAAAYLPDMAMISPLQIPYQWLGFPHQRQCFFSLHFSCRDASIPFKASSLLWYIRFGSSFSFDLQVSEHRDFFCPLS
jgi:hypothetical protein